MTRTYISALSLPRRTLQLTSLGVLLASTLLSCSGENSGDEPSENGSGGAATGGTNGSGGAALTGGTGSGGDTPSGGTSGGDTGGTLGSGGLVATGGEGPGSGGADASGGMDGSGGEVGSGGADGTGGEEGTGGAAGFQPCPEAEPCKILPLGDSITVGYPGSDSYRVHLFELAVQGGHEITFVGSKMGGPDSVAGQDFPRSHEGVSGETVAQIANRVPSPALNTMPDIVLLHAGTNDLTGNNAQVTTHMASLLDELTTSAPDALIVVARVIPIFYMLQGVESYNDSVEALAVERANQGKHIIVVDHFEGFPQSELGDTVHPNETGYERMAQTWYDGIESYLR
jgi:lysophospholipase L1-like esterase